MISLDEYCYNYWKCSRNIQPKLLMYHVYNYNRYYIDEWESGIYWWTGMGKLGVSAYMIQILKNTFWLSVNNFSHVYGYSVLNKVNLQYID